MSQKHSELVASLRSSWWETPGSNKDKTPLLMDQDCTGPLTGLLLPWLIEIPVSCEECSVRRAGVQLRTTCSEDKIRQGDWRSNDNFSLITSQILHCFQIGIFWRPTQRSIWKSTETKCDISIYEFTPDTFLCYSWYLFKHKEIPKLWSV